MIILYAFITIYTIAVIIYLYEVIFKGYPLEFNLKIDEIVLFVVYVGVLYFLIFK